MILYACIVRLQDGLPLSASTDFHPNKQVLECKRWLRRLCVNLCQRPARGTAMVCDHSIHFRSAGDVSSLTICSSSFPSAAAFSFLEELIWEFSSSYNSTAIALASRPYTFLEFDCVIQRVKHNYNDGASPPIHPDRGTTPVTVQFEEVAELNGVANGHTAAQVSPANHRMGPVSLLGILSLTLNIMCAALNLIRGVHLAENSFQDGYDNAGRVLAFLMAFSASILQCYLYLFYCPSRTLKSWGLLLGIGLCNLHLYGLRSLWQIGFHVFVAFLSAVQIVTRRPLDRHSDCGV
ncbi:vesicle-trafficking protein SEC22c isoform X1 [Bufo bufo]|uniref:vesicle-trafficking protein SEC22c isoform X1 n=1 Tax=Bufo bufo TaxID=8384 RepID=UPI001ABE3CF7|nr:vesicle-trafficking protein SEC22c isoform X1 [Bufo bufo]XP_040287277.1 vesicle-trafficking protein SEC22c isoform X1 [Bufo bufo]